MRRGFLLFCAGVLSLGLTGCTGGDLSEPEEGTETGPPDDSRSGARERESDTGNSVEPDASTESDAGTTADADGKSGRTIPNRITTDGGASFSSTIGAGEEIAVELAANQGDFVALYLRRAAGTEWQPALYLHRTGGEQERIAWSEPSDSGPAHIPYQDSGLDQGWEFYQSGTYDLTLANLADSGGEFEFELACLAGPCTDSGSNDGDGGGGGEDDDGIPAERDNCPSTSNPDQQNQDHDVWGDACDPNPNTFECPSASGSELKRMLRAAYRDRRVLSYDRARHDLFSTVENRNGSVETVYIGESFQTSGIPDPNEYNTEHVWPRSQMRTTEGATFTDLNHLQPADAAANSERSNLPFDEVSGYTEWSSNGAQRGENDSGWTVFEPRDARKGDIARALFYYSVIYERSIDIDAESDGRGIGIGDEQTLRTWHNQTDPVDSRDERRNRLVQEAQQNRNPFVDCPQLVDQIDDF